MPLELERVEKDEDEERRARRVEPGRPRTPENTSLGMIRLSDDGEAHGQRSSSPSPQLPLSLLSSTSSGSSSVSQRS